MRWSPAIFLPLAVTSLSHVSVHAEAKIFTSIEQAQKRIFPGQTLKKTAVKSLNFDKVFKRIYIKLYNL